MKRTKQTGKLLTCLFLAFSFIITTALPTFASVVFTNGTNTVPDGNYLVTNDGDDKYVEATNSFDEKGTEKFFLVTQDSSKSALTELSYKGKTYTLTAVLVETDIAQMNYNGVSIFSGLGVTDHTVFFDDGTYNDSHSSAYTRYSSPNLSMVGLNRDGNDPKVILTRSPRSKTSDTDVTAHIHDTMERNTVMHENIYMENINFNGQNKDMYPVGGSVTTAPTGTLGKNRGENAFMVAAGSAGFVMRDCVISDVGASNANDSFYTALKRKNVAINFYRSTGQHNIEGLQIRNVKTRGNLGIITTNESSGNYFKDITIDGTAASAASMSVKVEDNSEAVVPRKDIAAVFSGELNFSGNVTKEKVHIQDYRYDNVALPSDFRYLHAYTYNGSVSTSAVDALRTLPTASTSRGIMDMEDNSWVIDTETVSNVSAELTKINKVVDRANTSEIKIAPMNIKLIANSGGVIPSFDVPDCGRKEILITAVKDVDTLMTDTEQIPFAQGAIVNIDLNQKGKTTFANFDFEATNSYTLQEVIVGIDPDVVAANLEDTRETDTITGYPTYDTYQPAAVVNPAITNTTKDNFINCKFVSLVNRINLTNTQVSATVGTQHQFGAELTDTENNSYTLTGATIPNIKGTADDKSIGWFSSDETVATVDNTGKVIFLTEGPVTIIAKALDQKNSGEIEKPFAYYTFTVGPKIVNYEVRYHGNGNTGGNTPPNSTVAQNSIVRVAPRGDLKRDNYTFKGWSMNQDGSGQLYKESDKVTVTGDIDFYAVWEKVKIYEVRYHGNGNTKGDVPSNRTVDENTKIEVAGQGNLERVQHQFKGWSMNQDGSGKLYSGKEEVVVTGDIDFYAVWQKTKTGDPDPTPDPDSNDDKKPIETEGASTSDHTPKKAAVLLAALGVSFVIIKKAKKRVTE